MKFWKHKFWTEKFFCDTRNFLLQISVINLLIEKLGGVDFLVETINADKEYKNPLLP